MKKRSYRQYCAIARGLDVIGDRWTLLLVRELLLGPKRYGDLLSASPGIGTNLLADRLREMEAAGLVERTRLPPPAGSIVYRLTQAGAGLEPVMFALGRWGARFMSEPLQPDDHFAPGAYFVALRARFQPELAAGLRETYEFCIDGRVFEVRIDERGCSTSEGGALSPGAAFKMDVATLNELFFGRLTAEQAIASDRVQVSGDASALGRFCALFPRLLPESAQSESLQPAGLVVSRRSGR